MPTFGTSGYHTSPGEYLASGRARAFAGGGYGGMASGRGYIFHHNTGVQGSAPHELHSPFAAPAGTVTARPMPVHLPGPKPGAAQLLKPQSYIPGKPGGGGFLNRQRIFQRYPQPQAPQPQQPEQGALGRGAQPIGAIGYRPGGRMITTTKRTALGGRPAPRPIGQATIKGALGPGPLGLPPGARPMGPVPGSLELTPHAGTTTTAPRTGKRKRQEVFGQMMFGET